MPERDAYRVATADLEPLGGRKPENPDVTAVGLQEYADLKAELLRACDGQRIGVVVAERRSASSILSCAFTKQVWPGSAPSALRK